MYREQNPPSRVLPKPSHGTGAPTSRFAELLEGLRAEYETLHQEFIMYATQHHPMETGGEARLQQYHQQLTDLQKTLGDMERAHLAAKQKYDDDLDQIRFEVAAGNLRRLVGETPAVLMDIPPLPKIEAEIMALTGGMKRTASEMATRDASVHPPPAVHRRGSTGAIPPKKEPKPQERGEPVGKEVTAGFDWMVVYNPKAVRAITVDMLHTLSHESVVCSVRFNHECRLLATGSNRLTSIFDVASGQHLAALRDPETPATGDFYERSVAFSPDGLLLASGSEDRHVRVWDVGTSQLRWRLRGHEQDVYGIEFTPNGRQVVSASGDRSIRVWSVATGVCEHVLQVPGESSAPKEAGLTSVAVSPDGRFVAAGSLDRHIHVWQLDTGTLVASLEGHRDSVYSVAFSSDGLCLLSGSLDKTVKVWEAVAADGDGSAGPASWTCKQTVLGHKDFVLSVACTGDRRWMLSGSKDRAVQFWDMEHACTQLMLQGHKNSVICVAASPGERALFATGSGDGRARIWSYAPVSE